MQPCDRSMPSCRRTATATGRWLSAWIRLRPKAHFFGGDLVGMVVAEYLKADAVVVPISCNDAVDRGISHLWSRPRPALARRL
jgi:hypothetical protein